jgi:hypothetical protein
LLIDVIVLLSSDVMSAIVLVGCTGSLAVVVTGLIRGGVGSFRRFFPSGVFATGGCSQPAATAANEGPPVAYLMVGAVVFRGRRTLSTIVGAVPKRLRNFSMSSGEIVVSPWRLLRMGPSHPGTFVFEFIVVCLK